ncbi:SPOSA6832_02569 [Sporobolomyces salmonicolor]|uniref:SPOSA6832_02569-mRNA-1:cds n=1 Tax=Sporidiobolus salmonicolor TaxID=5005 RepID=A0A0D6EMP5_SPOSA|nr:SPOSA6832_02569 [Sporobolomyces salmonicolor]
MSSTKVPASPPGDGTYDLKRGVPVDSFSPSEVSDSKSPSVLEASFDDHLVLSEVEHHKLLRRIDWKLLPIILVSYCIVRLDLGKWGSYSPPLSSDISNAGIMNAETGDSLKKRLHLDAEQWALALLAFYPPYMVVEPIATFFLKITSPSVWLARIMAAVTAGPSEKRLLRFNSLTVSSSLQNFGGLITTRVRTLLDHRPSAFVSKLTFPTSHPVLGAFEGSYFTSIVFHWSYWYTPAEMAPRILLLYVANASWLFIIEGAMPLVLGIIVYFILPDFPDTAKWLTIGEREYIVKHLHKDAPKTTAKTWNSEEVRKLLEDPTFWLFSLFWACSAVGVWGISTVLPFVISDMGITGSAGTNLLQIPPAATGVAMCIISSYLIRNRGISAFPVILAIQLGVIVSFICLITVEPAGVRYAAACVVTGASTSAYACMWPRRVAAIRGTSAAAFGIGITNAISQLSGIVGPQLYRSDYGPRYIASFEASAALVAANVVLVSALWFLMERPLDRFPWLKKRVQAQSQLKEEDLVAAKLGETVGET